MAARARRLAREAGRAAAGLARRQPLALGVAFFLFGVLCGYGGGRWWPALAGSAVCAAALLGSAADRSAAGGGVRMAAAAALLFLLGWGRAAWDSAGRAAEAERLLAARETRLTFVCRVGPSVSVAHVRGEAAKYTFKAEQVRVEGETPFALRYLPVGVNWYGAHQAGDGDAPQAGAVWRVRGRAKVAQGRDGLPALTVNTGEDRAERVAAEDAGAWAVRIAKARRQAVRRVAIGIEDWGVIPALNQAMLLGCRNEMPRAMRRVFADSGTIHVFAISGLHIALLAGVLALLVKAAGMPRTHWVLAVGPLLVFYTLTTGARPSAVRACLMAVLFLAAPLLGRRPNGLAALAGTALLTHLAAPWLVFDVGSVLSFVVMGGLVVFCAPLCGLVRRACGLDALVIRVRLLDAAGRPAAARRVRDAARAARALTNAFAVSLAAWLSSVPLTAHYFGRFTPGGLFANLLIAPCSFLIVVSGCLGLAASFVSDWAASCFNHAAGLFTWLMVKTAEWTVSFKWASVRVAKWSPWMVWSWFAALACLAAWLHARRAPDGLEWMEADDSR